MDSPSITTMMPIMWCMLVVFMIMIRRRNVKKLLLPPGPWGLPIIGNLHMLGALPHRTLQNMARKYGPIMFLRLGNIPAIVVSSPEVAELFLKTHDAVFASRPRIEAVEQMSGDNNGFAFAPYGACWRKLRRMCTEHVLSPARVKSFAPMRREEVGRMVDSIKAAAVGGQLVDLTLKVGEVIGDMSCRMILGCSTRDKYNLRPIAEEAIFLALAFNIADYIPILQPLNLQGFNKQLKSVRERIDAVLEEIIDDGKRNACADSKRSPSFLEILMCDSTMQLTNIKAVVLELLLASFDSSSMAIDWTMCELIRNPRVMALLQAEIHSVLGPNRTSVEETDLPNMSYLEMVVKESLRLHPVAPLLIPHESVQDMEIMGYFIPKKSRIIINAWALGRDEQTWSQNVHQFYPERFISNNHIDLTGRDFRLLPFGSGRRGCPGAHIGLTILQLVVAQLVHSFNWDLPNDDHHTNLDMTERFKGTIPRAKHLLLKPTCRMPPI